MRWFLRNNRFYIGPVSDLQIDILLSTDRFPSCGIACQADSGKVETYLTIPEGKISAKELENFRLMGPCA